jgi:NAD(P)-dependent dehydrogenase (short-subunit alcohol dehydrogenase family)
MGGLITLPGLGFYHASKFALEGLSDTLGKEVKDLGIHVTAVEPGSFRTDWAGRSMVRAPRSIPDYDALMNPIREGRQQVSGHQLGDPKRAAAAIVKLAQADDPPAHLLLGSDAAKLVAAFTLLPPMSLVTISHDVRFPPDRDQIAPLRQVT